MNEMYAVIREGESNELQHYGVLGMKWGIHRAQKKGTSVDAQDNIFHRTKTRTTRGLERTLNKAKKRNARAAAKGKEQRYDVEGIKRDLAASRKNDEKIRDYISKESTVKTLGKAALFGSRGSLRYDQIRANQAKGSSTAKNRVGATLAGAASRIFEPTLTRSVVGTASGAAKGILTAKKLGARQFTKVLAKEGGRQGFTRSLGAKIGNTMVGVVDANTIANPSAYKKKKKK